MFYLYPVPMKKCLLTISLVAAAFAVFAQKGLKYAAVAESNTYQIIDTTGKVLVDSILQPDWVEVYSWGYDEGIFKFEHNGKMGYKDIRNQVVLPAVYDEVSDFVNNAGIVNKGGKMGVVNRKGAWVIQPTYKYIAHADSNGLLIVVDEEGLLGLMTVKGKTILKPTYLIYQEWPKFSDGLLPVAVRKQKPGMVQTYELGSLHVGFIDTKGRLIIDTVWETDRGMWLDVVSSIGRQTAGMCFSGMERTREAAYQNPYRPLHDYYRFSGGRSLARKDGKNVVINTQGDILFSLPDTLERVYNYGGLFHFTNEAQAKARNERAMYGLYDGRGRVVYRSIYPAASEIRDGYMLIKLSDTSYQYLDTSGHPAFNGKTFRHAFSFSSGYAMVLISKESKLQNGLIDTRGRIMAYDSTSMPSHTPSDNGWFTISTRTGWGFVDADGKQMIPPMYPSLYRFWNGYCGYRNRDRKAGYIDEQNRIVIPAKYYDVMDFQVLKIK